MITAGQIARAAAPAKTRMAMPAHMEAMIGAPVRPRLQIAPASPVVDLDAIEAGRKAKQLAEDAGFAKLARLSKEHQRRKAREAELAMKRERDRRVKLGILTDYRKHTERHHRLIAILSEITRHPVIAIKGTSRMQEVTKVRHIACWLIHKHCIDGRGRGLGYPRIARFMCKNDHTTILSSIRRVNDNAELNAMALDLERQVLEIEAQRYGGVNGQ